MRESFGIDSTWGGRSMAKAYSPDMRQRVIERVEGDASRREAAEHYEVSPSAAVIWVKCFRESGRCAAKPRGGSTSPLEKHADFLLALIEVEPDLTLDEVVCAMRAEYFSLSLMHKRRARWMQYSRPWVPPMSVQCLRCAGRRNVRRLPPALNTRHPQLDGCSVPHEHGSKWARTLA
jgi:transposase